MIAFSLRRVLPVNCICHQVWIKRGLVDVTMPQTARLGPTLLMVDGYRILYRLCLDDDG